MNEEQDGPRENCGVVGIIDLQGREAVRRAVMMLTALQNRGQDAAGIATKNHGFHLHRDLGYVEQVFNAQSIAEHNLEGSLISGHTRWRIQGDKTLACTQPIIAGEGRSRIAVSHNGNIEDLRPLRDRLATRGIATLDPDYDSNYLAHVIAHAPGRNHIERIQNGLQGIEGSYALIVITEDGHLLGVRDPWANRPLSMARLEDGKGGYTGIAMASETSAFQAIGSTRRANWYEFRPGEIIDVSLNGINYSRLRDNAAPRRCSFEPIYMAYDTSVTGGKTNDSFRTRLGQMLAKNHPGSGDMVTAVPESSRSSTHAYAQATGRPEREIIKKKRHAIRRNFIEGEVEEREAQIEAKYDISPDAEGKSVDVVEDSYVCGITAEYLFGEMKTKYGAAKINALSAAPKVVANCTLGVSMRSGEGELLAVHEDTGVLKTAQEILDKIKADSIYFLPLQDLKEVIRQWGDDPEGYCYQCFGDQGLGPLTPRAQRPMTKEFVWLRK